MILRYLAKHGSRNFMVTNGAMVPSIQHNFRTALPQKILLILDVGPYLSKFLVSDEGIWRHVIFLARWALVIICLKEGIPYTWWAKKQTVVMPLVWPGLKAL